jgi:hypothetical protein
VRVNMRVHLLDRESRARLPQVGVCVSKTPAAKESGSVRPGKTNDFNVTT